MKVTPRFMVRAALVTTAAGVIGAFGACKDSTEPPPPPPPPGIIAPSALTATEATGTPLRVDLAWTDNANNEIGFRVERCSGAGCTNFAQIGANTALNVVAFADTFGLAAATAYNYRVAAFNATDTSTFATATVTLGSPQPANTFTLLTTGEISTCNSDAGPRATAAIIDSITTGDANAFAVTTGNNLAGTGGTFETCFDAKGWGQLKSKVNFALGNGDFDGRNAAAVYGYFGDRTGPASKGWFSFDKGNWHIVVLNTSDAEHGEDATFGITRDPVTQAEVQVPSEQVDWLSADLAANTKPCVAVISWERRFYTTGTGGLGRQFNMVRLGGVMRDNGVDLLISAKDKLYARFAPADVRSGAPDPAGFRQFIVGTGGRTGDNVAGPAPALREAQIDHQWGVLKLTLAENSYSWEFLNTVSGGPTDKSETPVPCH